MPGVSLDSQSLIPCAPVGQVSANPRIPSVARTSPEFTESRSDVIIGRAMPKASEYVFYHPESLTRWDRCRKPWIAARGKAGHPWLRIQDLRHAFAIKLAEAGCEMHFISEVLGHHSIDFTRKQYAKFSPQSATRAVLRVLEGGKNGTNLAQAV